jgi:hypothetical protein
MAASVEDLVKPLTVDEVRESIYSTLAANGVATTNWKPGAVVRTIIAGTAIVGSALSQLIALINKSGFLALSSGDWLTLVARYTRNVERIEARFASGQVEISNSTPGIYDFDPDELVFENSATKKQYRNTAAVHIDALEIDVPVPTEAFEQGSDSTAFVGEIDTLVPPIAGLTVTNATALIGLDAEEDPELQARADEKLGSLSPNGPPDAYSFVCKNATRLDGTAIGVTRVRMTKDGFGNVTVYVATATGGVTGTASDPATDLGALQDAVNKQAEPLAVNAALVSATPVVVAYTYQVWLYSSIALTDAQIKTAIETELATFTRTMPIGGDVISPEVGRIYISAIQAAIGRASANGVKLPIVRVDVILPASNLDLAISDVPVLGAVTGTVTQIAPFGTV